MAKVETYTALSREKSGIDTKELRKLGADFKRWKPDKAIHKLLQAAGGLIEEDAKQLASAGYRAKYKTSVGDRGEHRDYRGSGKIPPTIRKRVSKTRVSVFAGGEGVPLAGLWELGNRQGGRKSMAANSRGEFRHPVFGDTDRWVNQPMHPFLLPALSKNRRNIERFEGRAVAEAFREVGLDVT